MSFLKLVVENPNPDFPEALLSPASKPKPPPGLTSEAATWWRSVVEDYFLTPSDLEVLRLAAEALSTSQEALEAVRRDGQFHTNRFDQIVPHPGLKIAAQARNDFSRLLRQLALPEPEFDDDERVPTVA
jgi:phage terminase small subunit